MTTPILAINIDVDTDRGTRIGVPNLVDLFDEFKVKATFLFSLVPTIPDGPSSASSGQVS